MSAMAPCSSSIGAVIVTRNRLTMLQECVAALRYQTRPVDEIIVVDNDSTDGTAAWLAEQPALHVLRQVNLGGAGGFHTGIKTAVARGHDWVWCMDDDGYPAAECLERLLAVEDDGLFFRAPLVLARDDPARLAFKLRLSDGDVVETPEQFDAGAQAGLAWGVACPFNGVLIHRLLVSSIGLPLAGMFLWGDEGEYFLRARGAGYKAATISAARFRHPADRMFERSFKLFGRERYVVHADEPLRDYLAIRNRAYILRRYFTAALAVKHVVRHSIFYAKISGLRGMLWAMRAGWAGFRGDWRGHQRYLR